MAAISGSDKPTAGKAKIELPPLEGELGAARPAPNRNVIDRWLFQVPWWALVLILIGVWVAFAIAADDLYSDIFRQLKAGIEMTLRVTVISYSSALIIGLIVGVIRSYPPKPQTGTLKRFLSWVQLAVYNLATMFVEVMRGLPILIVLLVFAFVIVPEFKKYMLAEHGVEVTFRGASVETAIIGLSLAYGAYLSEIFRAGIQSIEKGQVEAARSLGMTQLQTMRLVILPQAFRRVLPPLGNDFIAMIKDSSLVAFLGIRDVTQIGKIYSGSSFQYLPTYLVVSVIYLTLTVIGSILVKLLERHLNQNEH